MNNSIEYSKLFSINAVIAIALITGTFTQLRFTGLPLGVSDLFFLAYIGYSFMVFSLTWQKRSCYKVLHPIRENIAPILIFLFCYLFLMISGTIFAIISQVNTGLSPYHNLLAFSYLTVLFFVLYVRADIDISLIASFTFFGIALVFSVFFIFSLFTRNIFGIDLYYLWTDRLMLLTKSPNHLADFIAPLPFLLLYFFFNSRSNLMRSFTIILVVILLCIGFMASSKATLVAWAIATFYLLFDKVISSSYVKYIIGFFFVSVITLFLIFHQVFFDYGMQKITNENYIHYINGLLYDIEIRTGLFLHALEVGSMSPLVGYGSGASSGIGDAFLGRESHNHVSEIFMISGVFALLFYLALMFFIAIRISYTKQSLLMASFIVITITSLFHVQLRQPLFWFYILFLIYATSSGWLSRKNALITQQII